MKAARVMDIEHDLGDAVALAALGRDCANAGVERHVLFLLLPGMQQARNLSFYRRAREAVESLLAGDRARLFRLPNAIAVAWRSMPEGLRSAARRQLDILAVEASWQVGMARAAVDELRLPADMPVLLDRIDAACVIASEDNAQALWPNDPHQREHRRMLSPEVLERLETVLGHTDLAAFQRRDPVRRLLSGVEVGDRVWDHRLLAADDLVGRLLPGCDIHSERWLFRKLSGTLDRRLLALLADPEELRDATPPALRIAIPVLLSPAFLQFDAKLPARLRGRVVLVMDAAEIIADPASFRFARNFAHARGYRLMLNHVSDQLLPLLEPRALELDYLGLRDSPGLRGMAPLLAALARDVTLVLTDVIERAALLWAWENGIQLASGPIIARPAAA